MTWVPVPNAVRKLREAAKLEQRELAKKSGITVNRPGILGGSIA